LCAFGRELGQLVGRFVAVNSFVSWRPAHLEWSLQEPGKVLALLSEDVNGPLAFPVPVSVATSEYCMVIDSN
jgi:hypothetical protein